jgi:hypothetical protein
MNTTDRTHIQQMYTSNDDVMVSAQYNATKGGSIVFGDID